MDMNLPIYTINFDETIFESGIDMIALTDNPAIEVMALRFNKQNDIMNFSIADVEKRIVVGPAIIPDKKIYRNDDGFEYYVIFTKDVVEKMIEKFNSEQRDIVFNFDHTETKVKAFINESWIIEDDQFDKSKLYDYDLPIGTWMISAKIEDDDAWEVIKKLDNIGFSIEGLMGVQEAFKKMNKNKTNSNMKKKKFIASKLVIKSKFNKATRKFDAEIVETKDDEILIAEDLEVGKEVTIVTDEGTVEVADDGIYVIPEEEVQVVVEEGEIVEVEEIVVEDEIDEVELEDKDIKDKDEKEEFEDETEDRYEELVSKIADLESRLEKLEGTVEEEIGEVEFKKVKGSSVDALIAFNKRKK